MGNGGRIILVADDDRDDLELFEEILSELEPGATVIAVSNGKSALDILVQQDPAQAPNLIILDYNMPDLTGAAVIKSIAQEERYHGVPKIVWSTSNATLYEEICLTNGADYFFQKPDNINAIEALAKRMLSITV